MSINSRIVIGQTSEKKMKRLLILLYLLSVHICSSASADTKNIPIEVGEVKIDVPAPTGLFEISSISPETRKIYEIMTPSYNRLLAVFLPEDELGIIMKGEQPELQRYMSLQVFRKLENEIISAAQFQKIIAPLKEQKSTILSKYKNHVAESLKSVGDNISREYNKSLDIKLGEQVHLGIFLEQQNALGFVTLTKYQTKEENKELEYIVVVGTTMLLTKDKTLFAYVFSPYESQDDINWVKSKSQEWANSILTSNKTSSRPSVSTFISTSLSRLELDGVLGKSMGGLFLGGVIALLIGLFQGIKLIFRKRKKNTYGKFSGPNKHAPPCAIHSSDKTLVRNEDVEWWNGLSVEDCKAFEQQDNITKMAALQEFMEEGRLSKEAAAKKVRTNFPFYYWSLEQRQQDEERFQLSTSDAKLPYILKDRINRATMSHKIDSDALNNASSFNALIRNLIRSDSV